MKFTRRAKFNRGGACRKVLHGFRIAADEQLKVNRRAIRKDDLGHNLNHPGHASVSVRSKLPNCKIVGISEACWHLDNRIPVASGFEIRFKLRGSLAVLPVILAIGVEFEGVTDCIERIWAMEVRGSKRDRGRILHPHMEFGRNGQDRIGSWCVGQSVSAN